MNARVIGVLAGLVLLLSVAEGLFAPHYDPKFPWHRLPGFYALVGLGMSVVFIVLTKLGKGVLQRPEDGDA